MSLSTYSMSGVVDSQERSRRPPREKLLRAAAILRATGMTDVEIVSVLRLSERSLRRWKAEARDVEADVKSQFAAFRAAAKDVD